MTIKETIERLQILIKAGIPPETPLCIASTDYDKMEDRVLVVGFTEIYHIEDGIMTGIYGEDRSRQMMLPEERKGDFVVINVAGVDTSDYENEQRTKGLLSWKDFGAHRFSE